MTTEPLRVVEKIETSDAVVDAAPAPAAAPRQEPVTVRLTVPIEAHGERVTALTLRVPKVEDIEAVDMLGGKVSARMMSDLIVRLAGIPRSSVLQLDRLDYIECARAADSFFTKRAPTS